MTPLPLPLQCEHHHLFVLNPFMTTPLPLPLQCEHLYLIALNPFMMTPLPLPLQCEHLYLIALNPFMMTPLPLPLQCEHLYLIAFNPFMAEKYQFSVAVAVVHERVFYPVRRRHRVLADLAYLDVCIGELLSHLICEGVQKR